MPWEIIIPIIGLAVWVIANLAKGGADAKKAALQRPRPQQRPRPVTSDIDRFLEEINRQRQLQKQPGQAVATKIQPVAQQQKSNRPRPSKQRQRSALVSKPPRPAAVVVVKPTVVTAQEEIPLLLEEDVPTTHRPRAGESPLSVAVIKPKSVPSHLKQLQRLLSSSEGLRTAFILREVLGARAACLADDLPDFGRNYNLKQECTFRA